MTTKIVILWIVGALTIVPYSIYYLLFYAQPDQYALLIVLPLFWVFGFWGIAGPILTIIRIRKIMKTLEGTKDIDQIKLAFERNDGEEIIVDIISRENHIPKFIAKELYKRILAKAQTKEA